MDPDHSTNSDRLAYLYVNLVGQVVTVHTVDGAISEGLFVSCTDPETPEDEAGVFISCPRFLRSDLHKPLDGAGFDSETKLFLYGNMVMMDAANVKMRTETPGAGNVYNYRGEHDLKALDWAEAGNDELLEDDRTGGQWDQFEENRKRFGVHTSYNEEIYTTKLDMSKKSKEEIQRAERIAREIEGSATRGVQHQAERGGAAAVDLDDAALYSDVARKPKRGAEAPAAQSGRKGVDAGKAAAVGAAGAAAAAGGKRGADEASAPPPLEGPHSRDFNPNPKALPFVPPARPIVKDYLKSLADAIQTNAACYHSEPDWPGEAEHYDKDDSDYSSRGQHQGSMSPNTFQGGPPMPPQQQQSYGQMPPGAQPNYGRPPHQAMPPHGMNPNPNQHHMPPPQHQNQYQQQQQGSGMGGYAGPPMGQHHQHYQDPAMMANNQGPSPQQQQQQQQRMGPGPQQQQQRVPSSKSSQPQQPVVTALPQQQQQQQQQHQAVAPVDSSAPSEKQAVTKKLSRGMKGSQSRADAAGDNAPTGGKRGGK